ncbi:MAG: hypothetical protein OEY66_03045 [Gammaproteobacteria bacterium]|nr:hypothetical protein [Gammaproteobacteria bacterium]
MSWLNAISSFTLFVIVSSATVHAGTLERQQAKRIHDRLTGISPSNTILDTMEAMIINDPSGETAAYEAMNNAAFYNVTLKNFAAPWTNEEQSVFVPLNDYTATVIGMIRDSVDFRQVLSGDIIYTGSVSPAYSNNNNDHYEALEAAGSDFSDPTVLQKKIQSNVTGLATAATAGVITSRAAAAAFFVDGTNRAMFRFTLINHLCTDLEQIKDISRVPDHIHRDVSRSPGGDSRIFMNNCIGCHAGMDALYGAYAYYNFNNDTQQLDYTPGVVTDKFNINGNNFKYGHVTTDDSWLNYWRNGQNQLLGWDSTTVLDENGHSFGNGAKSMGIELANSRAFSRCQVKKVFKAVCFRESDNYTADRNQVTAITNDFENNGYDMKRVFAKTAAYCKGN